MLALDSIEHSKAVITIFFSLRNIRFGGCICQNKQSHSPLTQPKESFIIVDSAEGKLYQRCISIREALTTVTQYKGSFISIESA